MAFPGGKRFALAFLDDTDVARVENIKPVYDELRRNDIRGTKTVWMLRSPVWSKNFHRSQTMEERDYADFVLQLHRDGFEIASHGASMESSLRAETIYAFEKFCELFGYYPRVHVNHAENRDNIYWGIERFGSRIIRTLIRWRQPYAADGSPLFQGHQPGSPYFWGDVCHEHVHYVRNFCFDEINQSRLNPSQPYHDPRTPFVRYWFSGLDAPDVLSFNRLLSPKRIDCLESEGGVCIVATHFGKFFVRDGALNSQTREIIQDLGRRQGWYPSVSELLDFLRTRSEWCPIRRAELLRLEWRWLIYRLRAKRDERPEWAPK